MLYTRQCHRQGQSYKYCIANGIQQKKLIGRVVVGLKGRIGIGRFVRVSVGNYFAARQFVRVPEDNTVQQHQGKEHQDAIGD